jgi:hypothetical protein
MERNKIKIIKKAAKPVSADDSIKMELLQLRRAMLALLPKIEKVLKIDKPKV